MFTKPLGRTGGVDAGRAVAGDVQRTARALPAAHGQNDGFRVHAGTGRPVRFMAVTVLSAANVHAPWC